MRNLVVKVGLSAILCLVLSVAVSASSKIAIIKVNSGSAKLDGITITKASLAGEGQLLELGEQAEVRVQLLGSKNEFTLQNGARLLITRESLQDQAKDEMNRNSVAVAEDIGNKNTATASVTRDTVEFKTTVSMRPILPPVLEENEYVIYFEGETPYKIRPQDTINFEITSVGGRYDILAKFTDKAPLIPIAIAAEVIETGKGYGVLLRYTDADGGAHEFRNRFRILTPRQAQFLEEARVELLKDYLQKRHRDVVPLLQLASLYQDYDQNDMALVYLKKAQANRHLTNKEQRDSLNKTVKEMEEALKVALPSPATD